MISLMAAVGANGEIGEKNNLIWSVKEDLEWFREHTIGRPVVMGRRTHESIGRTLKYRLNIVLTRDIKYQTIGHAIAMHSIEEVLKYYKRHRKGRLMIIGGTEIYEQFLPLADRLYLTEMDTHHPHADAYFPEVNWGEWDRTHTKVGMGSKDVGFDYRFNIYRRITK